MADTLTKREVRRHVLFCQFGEGGPLMALGRYGWVPCDPRWAGFLSDKPRVDVSKFSDTPGAHAAFGAFIVPGLTYNVMLYGGELEKVDWYEG